MPAEARRCRAPDTSRPPPGRKPKPPRETGRQNKTLHLEGAEDAPVFADGMMWRLGSAFCGRVEADG